jgi:hypothetical protein
MMKAIITKGKIILIVATLSTISSGAWLAYGAPEPQATERPTRPPTFTPNRNRPVPNPEPKPSPNKPTESNGASKTKWEYMATEEGMNLIVDGQMNEALKAKMNFTGAAGWELVTVFNEGGKKIFIYKRQS